MVSTDILEYLNVWPRYFGWPFQRDRGGPLIDRQGVVVGIKAEPRGCLFSKTPIVYIQTSHFLNWIFGGDASDDQ